jgi:hypothetical protein
MGQIAGRIVIILWLCTSVVFPVWLQMAGAQLTAREYFHFFVSQLFTGLIGASLSYFIVMYINVRAFYPKLLPGDARDEQAVRDLTTAGRPIKWYFVVLVIVPILSLMISVSPFMRSRDASAAAAEAELALAFLVLGATGILGFLVCFYFGGRIQTDLMALRVAVSPEGIDSAHNMETPSSLLGSTRRKA